jgi:hypothetical protein
VKKYRTRPEGNWRRACSASVRPEEPGTRVEVLTFVQTPVSASILQALWVTRLPSYSTRSRSPFRSRMTGTAGEMPPAVSYRMEPSHPVMT